MHLLEIGLQAVQLSPYSAGPAAPHARTPGHGHCFPGMLWSPSPFGSRSAIRPRNLPPSSSRLHRGYNKAPRGAALMPPTARHGVSRRLIETPARSRPSVRCDMDVRRRRHLAAINPGTERQTQHHTSGVVLSHFKSEPKPHSRRIAYPICPVSTDPGRWAHQRPAATTLADNVHYVHDDRLYSLLNEWSRGDSNP